MPSHSSIRSVVAPEVEPFEFDDIDLALLKTLVSDARMSQRQVANALGISAPTVGERMSKLERAGVITHYSAFVNWPALGYPLTVFLSITATPGSDIGEIMARLWTVSEVEEVYLVTGDLDLLAKLRARDHNHLRALLMDKIWQIPGIQGTSTQISFAEMPNKNYASLLLEQMQRP